MKQLELNRYSKLLDEVMTEYLASCPDPYEPSGFYNYVAQRDAEQHPIPLTWFDASAATSLIIHHKDLKNQYDIPPNAIELAGTMFRIANHKLGWLDLHDADALSSYLSYDAPMRKNYMLLLHDLVFCITRFPKNPETCKWYAYLMPLLACIPKKDFIKPCYIARYMLHLINRFSLVPSKGEHQRDLDTDFLRCIQSLEPLMKNCKDYGPLDPVTRCMLYRDVLSEYATIFLGSLLQRSAVLEDIGILAREVVAQHHIEYQLLERAYRKQMEKEAI